MGDLKFRINISKIFFKIHLTKAECIFFYSFVYVWVSWFVRETPDQTKYDTDLKFSTHTPLVKTSYFGFFKKVTMRAASLGKLPCHVDFPHTSSNALFLFFRKSDPERR